MQPPLFEETITLPKLESHLWEAANILRGSPVDRTDWKSYILPLLFFKRICDVWDEEYAEDGRDLRRGLRRRASLPGPGRLPLERRARDAGQRRHRPATTPCAASKPPTRSTSTASLATPSGPTRIACPTPCSRTSSSTSRRCTWATSRVTSDIIGDAYEYLIKKFADATNKKAGEFYTPRSVVRLMVDILDPQEGETIYDPACGTGGMLLAAVEHVRDKGGDPRTFFGKLYGQEKNLTTASVARMNLLLHGIEDFQIERGDTLRNPVFTDPSTGGLATFDCVIANPPFSLKQWGREIWENDPWGRAFAGLPTRQQRRLRLGAAHGHVDGPGAPAAWPWCCPRARSSAAASRARSGASCWRWI